MRYIAICTGVEAVAQYCRVRGHRACILRHLLYGDHVCKDSSALNYMARMMRWCVEQT